MTEKRAAAEKPEAEKPAVEQLAVEKPAAVRQAVEEPILSHRKLNGGAGGYGKQ
jgi:hypothetical protein